MLRIGAMPMAGSIISVFTNPDDYEVALGRDAGVEMLVTGRGEFRAQLSRIALPRLSLSAGMEHVSRIAVITVGSDLARISLPRRGPSFLTSGGRPFQPDEIVIHGPCHRLIERTDGPGRWKTIWLPAEVLSAYGHAVTGVALPVPPGESRWRPKPAALRSLISLHDDAIRLTAAQPGVVKNAQAAHGLEQQLIHGLIECLAPETVHPRTAVQERQTRIMLRFEDSLRAGGNWRTDIPDMCAAVGVPDRTLRAYCQAQLGMAPSRYIQLRRLQMTHRALGKAGSEEETVSAVARRYGFAALGRFAAAYRDQFGELPSMTLRESSGH
jgi:AraC-like DNA-binding protein